MSWLEAISSALGPGTGGAALAAGIYGGAVALEKEMSTDAKRDIAKFIKTSDIDPNRYGLINLVATVFETIFGHYHWTFRCFWRSTVASFLFLASLNLLFYLKYPHIFDASAEYADQSGILWLVLGDLLVFVLLSCLPDYLLLYKSRIILHILTKKPTVVNCGWFVCLDLVCSVLLSILVLTLAARFFVPSFAAAFGAIFGAIGNGLEILAGKSTANSALLLNIILMLSTLMTSVWTGLVMTATIVLKGTGPLNYTIRVSRWMFDVDAHPVRVIGLVSAAIVWAGSGVYGLL